MKIRELLNIILLSVSLSTVLISIISYILFKLKQKGGGDKTQNPLEGVYYRRYAPHVEKKYLAEEEERKNSGKSESGNKLKLGVVFGLVLIVILTALLLENYYNYRANINNKIMTANRIRDLIDDGLLQVYKYNPKLDINSQDEIQSETIKEYLVNISTSLKSNSFCIYSNSQSQKFNNNHRVSVNSWTNFLKTYDLNYSVTDNLNRKECVYIFPSVLSLTSTQREEVLALSKANQPMVISNFIGTLDGTGESVQGLFNELNLKMNKDEFGIKTYLSKLGASLNILPPGKNISVDAKDIYREFSSTKESLIIEKDSPRTIYKVVDKKLFLGFDPFYEQKNEIRSLNLFLLNEIAKISGSDIFYPSYWPNEYLGALSISLEVGDNFQINNKFIDLFEEKKLLFSLIVSQNYTQNYVQSYEAKFSEVIPFLKQTEANDDMSTYEIFSFLSKFRLDVEEKAALKVIGYSHQNRNQILKTFNAALQNNFKYFLGPEKYLNSVPVKIHNDFFYVESLNYEDIQADKKLILEEKPLQKLLKTRVLESGGLLNYVLRANEINRIDQENYFKSLTDQEQLKNIWLSDVGSIVNWFLIREKVKLQFENGDNGLELKIINNSEKMVKGYSILLNSPKTPQNKEVKLIKLNKDFYRIIINELKPNAEISIQLK